VFTFAGLDQATDSPNEWPQGTRGYLNRLATRRRLFQIGAFSGLIVEDVLHEDPRFLPSDKARNVEAKHLCSGSYADVTFRWAAPVHHFASIDQYQTTKRR
jgi:hypothetical protein